MTPPVFANPFVAATEDDPVWILDGGLATTLESRGFDLDDPLWSARLLVEAPEAIRRAHADFLEAGADCIATASYQASLEGFAARGIDRAQGEALLHRSVALAVEARDAFWRDARVAEGRSAAGTTRRRPLVAASVGPYGAFLADGSEYTGRYPVGRPGLEAFHRKRWHLFAQSEADLLACETIPSGEEARVLLGLMAETPDTPAWLSLSCRDTRRLCDGTPIEDVALLCDRVPNLVAVGVNCTDPSSIEAILTELRRSTDKPLIAYPNAGGLYEIESRSWSSTPAPDGWLGASHEWRRLGARAVGGCCRIGPGTISALRVALVNKQSE